MATDDKLVTRLVSAARREVTKRREKKIGPVKTNAFKSVVTFKMAKKNIVAQTKGNYPAPMVAPVSYTHLTLPTILLV